MLVSLAPYIIGLEHRYQSLQHYSTTVFNGHIISGAIGTENNYWCKYQRFRLMQHFGSVLNSLQLVILCGAYSCWNEAYIGFLDRLWSSYSAIGFHSLNPISQCQKCAKAVNCQCFSDGTEKWERVILLL